MREVHREAFGEGITMLEAGKPLPHSNKLLPYHPTLDKNGILRLGGRIDLASLPFSRRHPIILPGDHHLTRILVKAEHVRLLHAGPTLVSASLARKFCIIKGRRIIRSITKGCVICKRAISQPKPQILGQLPPDRLNQGPVFDRVGVDYAGPILTKAGPIRKPSTLKSYVAVFVCFTTKAVHLELVSDLTTASFTATFR